MATVHQTMPDSDSASASTARAVTVHSLLWLALGNAVGVLLAALLLWPGANTWLAPATYGRWMPVHLNILLYGWCSLPLVGLLFRLYDTDRWLPIPSRVALGLWTVTLAAGSGSWLAGGSSGKLFLEWSGGARVLLAVNLLLLALVLAAGFAQSVARRQPERRARRGARLLLLLGLLAVPPLLYASASPALFPPINPDSGGATGGSLFGSTLGIVAIILLAPWVTARPRRSARPPALAWIVFAAQSVWFLLLDHGDHSHHEAAQCIALFSLLVWWPLLIGYLRAFVWPDGSARWLAALCAWGAILLATSLFTFLPGVLERWKFTNALVSHAHAAMAGMLSCFLVLVLLALSDDASFRVFRAYGPFWAWQLGAGLHTLSLWTLGTLEAAQPGLLFGPSRMADALYLVRLGAGVAMLAASLSWLRRSLGGAFLEEHAVRARSDLPLQTV